MTEETERRIGPYELLRTLGRGGSSTVYEAVDNRDGRLVALKVVTMPSDHAEEDTLTRRMERASRAVASLSHPNVARVYETGEAPFSDAPADAPHSRYIAMERVDGITLRDRLKREGGPLSLALAADILTQVASGVDAVHAAGVLHRDIKPSNILLATDGTVKLTDFGIARRPGDTMVTMEGVMIGSPHYISPEQTANQPATPASDIWALGIVLYEMVVGKVPFAGENIPATLYQIAHGDIPALPPYLPPAVRDVLTRALERDPARRFPSATSLADAFRRAVNHEVVVPSRPAVSTPLPLPTRAARRPSLAPLALALVGGVALVAGGFLAAPRFMTAADTNTSVVSDMEKRASVPSIEATARPAGTTAAEKARKPRSARPQSVAKAVPAPVIIPSISAVPVPSPQAASTPAAEPSPPPLVVETTPGATETPRPAPATPRTERRRDMPSAIPPSKPPLEVTRDLPPIDLVPLPKATPRPTPKPTPEPEPTPAPETPSPTPSPVPTPKPPPPPGPRSVETEGNEEGIEAEDPNTRLTGAWNGTHTGHAARLVLREPNRDTGEFRGTLTVQMPAGPVRIAIAGQVFDDGGITIRETRVLQAPVEKAWDLGINTGTFDPDDLTLSGSGRDKKGRTYQWSFRR
jgi:serine/threonine-protein kinase